MCVFDEMETRSILEIQGVLYVLKWLRILILVGEQHVTRVLPKVPSQELVFFNFWHFYRIQYILNDFIGNFYV